MRNVVRLSMAGAIALSGGFTWTVGQGGLAQTNKNLCELWASLPLPPYPKCEFQNFLVYVWMAVAALSAAWIVYEAVGWLRRRAARIPKESARTPINDDPPAKREVGVEWNIESNPEKVKFLGLSMGAAGLQAHHFAIRGRNKTINPIESPRAYIRAENTATEYQGLFNPGNGKLVPASQVATVPVGALIDIIVPFHSDRAPIPLAKFLAEFVPFTFFFASPTVNFRYTITKEQIEHRIREFQEAWNAKLFQSPQIQIRESSDADKPALSRSLLSENMARLGESASLALNDGKLSLWQAAIRAYSDTDDSEYASVGRAVAGGGVRPANNDQLLLWYVSGLASHSTIWGCKPPSDTTKPQNVKGYIFVIENGGLVAKNGPSVIENLMVSQKDIAAFIERVRKYPDEPI